MESTDAQEPQAHLSAEDTHLMLELTYLRGACGQLERELTQLRADRDVERSLTEAILRAMGDTTMQLGMLNAAVTRLLAEAELSEVVEIGRRGMVS